MNLYLVRHGQSEGNLAMPGAPHDPPLTGIGLAQARYAAQALAKEPVAALYASPMTRALETALPLSETLDMPVRVWPGLAETPRGGWNNVGSPADPASKTGLTAGEVRTLFPNTLVPQDLENDDPWWEQLASERRDAAYARAKRMLDALRAIHAHPDDTAVVITHGAFGSVLISVALDAAPADYNRYSQYNCGISLLLFAGEEVRLRYLNSVAHLPETLHTDPT